MLNLFYIAFLEYNIKWMFVDLGKLLVLISKVYKTLYIYLINNLSLKRYIKKMSFYEIIMNCIYIQYFID